MALGSAAAIVLLMILVWYQFGGTGGLLRGAALVTPNVAQLVVRVPWAGPDTPVQELMQALTSMYPTVHPVVLTSAAAVKQAAAEWHIPVLPVPQGASARDLPLASIAQATRRLPGGNTPMLGFVEAHTLLMAGTSETLSGVHRQVVGGVMAPEVMLLARARIAPQYSDFRDAVVGLGAGQEREHWIASLGGFPLAAAKEHLVVVANRRGIEASLAGPGGDNITTAGQLAGRMAPNVLAVDATDTLDVLHWRHSSDGKAGKTQGEVKQPTNVGASGSVNVDALIFTTVWQEGGQVAVRARPPLLDPSGGAGQEEVLVVHHNAKHDIDVVQPGQAGPHNPAVVPPVPGGEGAQPAVGLGAEGGQCRGKHSLTGKPIVGAFIPTHGKCVDGETPETLLTVFTTLMLRESADEADPHTAQKLQIQRNVLNALAAMAPRIAVVVFTDHPTMAGMAKEAGATVVEGGAVRHSSFGIPILTDMYAWGEAHTSAPMYGYMNADILFGPGLMDVVELALEAVAEGRIKDRVLVMGRRYNTRMPMPLPPDHSDNVPLGMPLDKLAELVQSLKDRGRVFQADAEDYFFITRQGWNLSHIPDFVPGRRMYDNWLVDHAYRDQMERIDITSCVWAVHLSGSDGDKAGLNNAREQPRYNFDVSWRYIGGLDKGTTTNANYVLTCQGQGNLGLAHRPHNEIRPSVPRGYPYTGINFEGHYDPLHRRRYWCPDSVPKGGPAPDAHTCTYK